MRLLLDTHVFLWSVTGSKSLKPRERAMIQRADAVFVSAASLWEIAIKAQLGKLRADVDAVCQAIEASGFVELPITAAHAAATARLPPIHKDPFDRLLIAQCMAEPLRLVTADPVLAPYSELVTVIR